MAFRQLGFAGLGACLLLLTGCADTLQAIPRQIVIQQVWTLEPGKWVGGHRVTAGLGDISLALGNPTLVAPFPGQVELAAQGVNCIYFSTPDIPAYLFRYCGVRHPQVGWRQPGQPMGRSQYLHFATLRRQPNGTWAIVEPSDQVLEKSLNPPPSRFRR
ncbi:MAG TPA: hypothetical protein IGR64_18975 [Leptolyngbyaceae cyanobacterium M65_K2018_010]|nr:hypothetical protein [Leptolyngbyaceae cyanobacterium M65_K2018_010]